MRNATIKIDQVRGLLEKGYELRIGNNSNTGTLILWEHEDSVADLYEVDVKQFISYFPNIRQCLDFQICRITYDPKTKKIINQFQEFTNVTPFLEEEKWQTMEDFEVQAEDVFSSFVELDRKIAAYMELPSENNEKEEEKKYGGK